MMQRFHVLIFALAFALTALSGSAQMVKERTRSITVFKRYQPADILLTSGKKNHQDEANIFLKNGALLYKENDKIMEADMSAIQEVYIGDYTFVKVDDQLAELINVHGENMLVLRRLIDVESYEEELIDASPITNIDSHRDFFNVTRLDAKESDVPFTVKEDYFFIVKGKAVPARVREARQAVSRKDKAYFDRIVSVPEFRWSQPKSLMQVLPLLTK